jgi:polar amino acid transport system permease protein
MIRFWLEKVWVQNAVLFALAAIMTYYWGWVFDFGYKFEWSMLYTVNETYQVNLGIEILKGLWMTVKLTAISSIIGLGLGTVLGLSRLSDFKPLRYTATCVIEFFRNTPLLVVLFFFYFAFPRALPDAAREWIFSFQFEFWTAAVAVGMYTSAFMAEVIRAGLQSIPKGILEAAYSSGLSYVQVLRKIILPLAFREIIPPLGSEFLNNMKNTSLAMFVGVADMTWQAQQAEALTFKGFEATTAASVMYLAFSLIISFLLNGVNGKLRTVGNTNRSLPVLFVSAFSWPFSTLSRLLFNPVGRFLRARRRQRAAATYVSARQAILRMALRRFGQAAVLAGKAAFLVLLGSCLYVTVKGLITFDWAAIAREFSNLIVWQFPHEEADPFLGMGGFTLSFIIAVVAIAASFAIGLLVGLGRSSNNRVFRIPSLLYIELIRGNPLIIVIYWVYFLIPVLFNTFFNTVWSASIALTLFTAAYLAEIVRGGIQNIPSGQVEAATASGLTYWQTMRKIILPQALKQMIPPIVGLFIAIFKDTSLVSILGVMELTSVAKAVDNRLMVASMEIWTTTALLYFIPCFLMSKYAASLERKLSPEKVNLKM